jgi:hypothetical protein
MSEASTALLRLGRCVDAHVRAPLPPERLASLRILVGLFATIFLIIRSGYLLDVSRLPASRFEPVGPLWFLDRPLPVGLVVGLLLVAIVTGVAFVVGWHHRVVAPVFGGLLLLLTTYDNSWQHVAHTENLLTLHVWILAVAPAADVWSLDALRRPRDSVVVARADHGWPVRLMSVVTVLTYVIAGWAKLHNGGLDWLTGAVLRNQIAHDNVRKIVLGDIHSPLGGLLSRHAWVFAPMALFTMVVELGAVVALCSRRLRPWWVGLGWAFHVGILAVMAILFAYPISGVAYASMLRPERLVGGAGRRLAQRGVGRRLVSLQPSTPSVRVR